MNPGFVVNLDRQTRDVHTLAMELPRGKSDDPSDVAATGRIWEARTEGTNFRTRWPPCPNPTSRIPRI